MRDYLDPMSRNQVGILYGIAFLIFSGVMAGWHWALTGISRDFGAGAAVGFLFAVGVMALASRRVRELD